MTITYNIGSLAAQLKPAAIHARHGNVIREGLMWQLKPLSSKGNQPEVHVSEEAQPLFQVIEGKYELIVSHNQKEFDLGELYLEKNTLMDLVFLLHTKDRIDPEAEYFIDDDEINAVSEHERRKLERKGERKFGATGNPLHRPDQKQQSGELASAMHAIQAHPLLATKTQFDGIADNLRDDPHTNEEAIAKTLELAYQKQLEAQPGFNPGTTPLPM